MGKFSGYLLASDADGTLFGHNGKISQKNIDAVKRFTDEGGLFIAATGRTADAARFIKEQLNVNAPCVLSNGTQLYDFEREEVIWKRTLSETELRAAKSVYESGLYKGAGTELHSGNKVYVFGATPESDEHEEREGLDAVKCEREYLSQVTDVHKALLTMRTEEEFAPLEEYLRSNSEVELNIAHTSATFGEVKYHYLELLPMGVNKATALEALCERLEIDRDKVLAVGDYYNDLAMLKFAKITAVPNESPEDIKELADYIVCDCVTGSVGGFIEELEKRF